MSSWEEEEGEVEEEIWQRGAGHCYRRSQWPRRTHQLSAPLPAAATIPFSLLLSQQSGSCSHASMTPLTRRLIAQNDASPSDFFKLKLTRCHFLYIVQQCNPRLRLRLHVTRLRLAPWQHGASNKRQNESALSSGGDAFILLRRVSDREHFNASSSHSQKNPLPLSELCSTSQVSRGRVMTPQLCWLNKQVHEWCRIKGSDAALVLSVYIRMTRLRFHL